MHRASSLKLLSVCFPTHTLGWPTCPGLLGIFPVLTLQVQHPRNPLSPINLTLPKFLTYSSIHPFICTDTTQTCVCMCTHMRTHIHTFNWIFPYCRVKSHNSRMLCYFHPTLPPMETSHDLKVVLKKILVKWMKKFICQGRLVKIRIERPCWYSICSNSYQNYVLIFIIFRAHTYR